MKARSYIYNIVAYIGLWTVCLSGYSQDSSKLKWSGFASVGGGRTLGNAEQFTADAPSDGLYTDRLSFTPDTIFGMQVMHQFDERLGVTAQIIARGPDNFEPVFEWAYLTYYFNANWEISVGRKRDPLYLYSQTLDVGYSYHWIRPPTEVYNLALTSSEGVFLRYVGNMGKLESDVTFGIGNTTAEVRVVGGGFLGDVEKVLTDVVGLSWDMVYDEWITGRVMHGITTGDFVSSNIGTFIEGNNIKFYNAALMFEFHSAFIMGECVLLNYEKDIRNHFAYYISGGLRFGKLTPHLTFAEYREHGAGAIQYESVTVGLRYDFRLNSAFKIEYATVQDQSDAGSGWYGDSDSITFAVDVIF